MDRSETECQDGGMYDSFWAVFRLYLFCLKKDCVYNTIFYLLSFAIISLSHLVIRSSYHSIRLTCLSFRSVIITCRPFFLYLHLSWFVTSPILFFDSLLFSKNCPSLLLSCSFVRLPPSNALLPIRFASLFSLQTNILCDMSVNVTQCNFMTDNDWMELEHKIKQLILLFAWIVRHFFMHSRRIWKTSPTYYTFELRTREYWKGRRAVQTKSRRIWSIFCSSFD